MGALIATLVGWATPTTKPWEIARGLHAALQDQTPPLSEVVVSEYFEQTENANIWATPPLMFEPSAALMRQAFSEFDPRVRHPYVSTELKLWIPQLAEEAPLYAGSRVEAVGRVVAANVLTPLNPPLVEWVVQLAPITVRHPLLYCRVTDSIENRPEPGLHYAVRGLVVAAGSIRLRGGGLADAAYMACSAMRRPYGEIESFTKFIEETGIDIAGLTESSRSEKEFADAFNGEFQRVLREKPQDADRLQKLTQEGA